MIDYQRVINIRKILGNYSLDNRKVRNAIFYERAELIFRTKNLKAMFVKVPNTRYHKYIKSLSQDFVNYYNEIKKLNRPIIISPFHFFGDSFSPIVMYSISEQINIDRIKILVALHQDIYGKESELGHFFFPERVGDNASIIKAVKDIKKGETILLYSDVCSLSIGAFKMKFHNMEIFNKPARMLLGVADIAKISNALIINMYCVFEDNQVKLKFYDYIDYKTQDAHKQIVKNIEHAVLNHCDQWHFSNNPFFYYS